MPRKWEGHWRDAVRYIVEKDPRLGPGAIEKALTRDAIATTGKYEGPSERTIARWRDEYMKLEDDQRLQYRVFYWPEAMLRGALPWEASATTLELLAYLREEGNPRPLLVAVQWFWRVTCASVPPAPMEDRWAAARQLASYEAASHDDNRAFARDIEWFLAFRSWESPDADARYESEQTRPPVFEPNTAWYVEEIRPFERPPSVFVNLEDPDVAPQVIEAMEGHAMPPFRRDELINAMRRIDIRESELPADLGGKR